MYFVRYEIRWYHYGCIYEGGTTFTYIPFDTLKQAIEYANNNPDYCKSDNFYDVGIYEVELHSDYDVPTLIKQL